MLSESNPEVVPAREFEVMRTEYRIEIADADMVALLKFEGENQRESTLSDQLDNLPGVSKTDYSGHYGAAIFFRIDQEYDNDENRVVISELITNYLWMCRNHPTVDV